MVNNEDNKNVAGNKQDKANKTEQGCRGKQPKQDYSNTQKTQGYKLSRIKPEQGRDKTKESENPGLKGKTISSSSTTQMANAVIGFVIQSTSKHTQTITKRPQNTKRGY